MQIPHRNVFDIGSNFLLYIDQNARNIFRKDCGSCREIHDSPIAAQDHYRGVSHNLSAKDAATLTLGRCGLGGDDERGREAERIWKDFVTEQDVQEISLG